MICTISFPSRNEDEAPKVAHIGLKQFDLQQRKQVPLDVDSENRLRVFINSKDVCRKLLSILAVAFWALKWFTGSCCRISGTCEWFHRAGRRQTRSTCNRRRGCFPRPRDNRHDLRLNCSQACRDCRALHCLWNNRRRGDWETWYGNLVFDDWRGQNPIIPSETPKIVCNSPISSVFYDTFEAWSREGTIFIRFMAPHLSALFHFLLSCINHV